MLEFAKFLRVIVFHGRPLTGDVAQKRGLTSVYYVAVGPPTRDVRAPTGGETSYRRRHPGGCSAE